MFSVFCFSFCGKALAQTGSEGDDTQPKPILVLGTGLDGGETRSGTIIIGSVSWEITGRIKERFVAAAANIEIGRVFAGATELDAYLKDRAQRLYNLRLFDQVVATYKPDVAASGDAICRVDVVVSLRESGTLIVLPGAAEDDVEGLLLQATVLRFDFLGTGGELELGLSRTWPSQVPGETRGDALLSYPFYLGPTKVITSFEAAPTIDDQGQCSIHADSTLEAQVPLLAGGGRHQVLLVPSIDASGDWIDRGALTVNPGLALRFGRIDWVGNRRQGYQVDIGGTILGTGLAALNSTYALDMNGHLLIGRDAELMGRVGLLYSPACNDCSLGTMVRGIDDRRLDGNAGAYENCDFWWNLGAFTFSKWFGMSWLRILDAEVHAGPFLDIAFPCSASGATLTSTVARYGAGLQIESFALYARPFYIYTSIGVDLRAALSAGTVLGVSTDGYPIAVLTSAVGIRY